MCGTCPWPDIVELFSDQVQTWVGPPQGAWEMLWPQEQALVAAAVPVRRAAFAAGRIAARELLAELGCDNRPLLADDDRVPCWPADIVGSISHSNALCVVAIARRNAVAALGVDTEPETPLEEELWPLVCGPDERRKLAQLPVEQRGHRAKLLFCIKESVYKAWFTQTRHPLGFADVDVCVDRAGSRYRARVLVEPSAARPAVRELQGRFTIDKGQIIVGTEVEVCG